MHREKTATRHETGEEDAVDVAIDAERYQAWYECELPPDVKGEGVLAGMGKRRIVQ